MARAQNKSAKKQVTAQQRFEALKQIALRAPLDQITWLGHYNKHFEYRAPNIGGIAWSPDELSVWNGGERIFLYEGQEVKPVYKSTERRFNRRRTAEEKREYQTASRAETRKLRELDTALRIR